jgi:hypothetical protein
MPDRKPPSLREFDFDEPHEAQPSLKAPKAYDPTVITESEAQWEASARFANEKREAREKQLRVRKKRLLAAGIVAVVLTAVAIPVVRAALRESEVAAGLRGVLDTVSQPVSSVGFKTEKDWLNVPSAGVVVEVPADSCSALVAIEQGKAEPVRLKVQRPKAPALEATGPVWCSCEAERLTVKYDGASERVALRWLNRHSGELGGVERLTTLSIKPFAVSDDSLALGCTDAAFRTWAASHREDDLKPLEPEKFPMAARMVAEGFEPAGVFPADRPFAVVRSDKGRCYLAAPHGTGGPFVVRADDGKRLTEKGNPTLGWCAHESAMSHSLWRAQGPGSEVAVVSAPADKVGGMTGLFDAAQRLGVQELKLLFVDGDLQADAVAALRASTVLKEMMAFPDSTGLPGKLDDTVVAFSLGQAGSYLPEVSPPVPFECFPEIDPTSVPRTFVCMQARAQMWRSDAAAKAQGAAEGKAPFWLAMFSGVTDKQGLKAAASLLRFARRMSLLGFEPQITGGVIDQPDGALLTGRRDDEQVIAVGLVKRAPWIVPLSDGPDWQLEGPLRPVKMAVGKQLRVRGKVPLGADPLSRRVVVWRK